MPADLHAATALRVQEVEAGYGRGWSFTPLHGKKPFLLEWNTLPRPSLEQCVAWARQGNVGLRTGAASEVAVVDEDWLDGSRARALNLPRTVTAITGSGKRHYYFIMPSGGLRNSVSKIADHVDIRGEGGQVVFPGSIHPETGEVYRWEEGLSPDDVELAELPAHVLALLAPPPKPKRSTTAPINGHGAGAKKVVERCIRDVATAPESTRNHALNRAAFTMGGLIATALVDRAEVEAALEAAATTAGLDSREIAATIRSGIEAGIAQPLQLVKFEPTARPSSPAAEPHDSGSNCDDRPKITLGPDQHALLDEIERILGDGDRPVLFNRGGMLVHTIRIPVDTSKQGVNRPAGLAVVVPIDPHALCDVMNRRIEFVRLRKVDGAWLEYAVPAPIALAQQLIARRQWKAIPSLHGLLAGPVILRDGSILTKNGYDRASGLYVDLDGLELPQIPERPTFEQARAALEELKEFYGTLPFVSPEDRSVALAATLTPISRPCYTNTPLFAVSAPSIGTGKSLLCDAVTIIATGRTAPAMSQAKDEDENRKLILALLMESAQVLLIDNCTKALSGASLCSALTQEYVRGRILGSSATVIVPANHATWFASGNNLPIEGDLRRRVLVCMLDAKTERPWQRSFKRDLRDIAKERRASLLAAGLTVLRWRLRTAADLRPEGLAPLGGFDDWARIVREALVLLGEPDPVGVMSRNDMTDPETNDLSSLHLGWEEATGVERTTAGELAEAAANCKPLMQALVAIGCVERGQTVNTKRLGKYIAKVADRRLNGRRIERVGESGGSAVWRLVIDDPKGFGGFGGLVSGHTRELENPSTRVDSGAQTHESHETPGGVGPQGGFDRPCAACGATAWWQEIEAGGWACRACKAPMGAGYVAAAAEGAV